MLGNYKFFKDVDKILNIKGKYVYLISFALSEDLDLVDLILKYNSNGIYTSMFLKDNLKSYYLISNHILTINDISTFSYYIKTDIIIDEKNDVLFIYNDYIE